MRKTRGFRLGRKLVKLWRWVLQPRRRPASGYLRMDPPEQQRCNKTMTKICDWGRRLRNKFCRAPSPRLLNYKKLEETATEAVTVPKGHLAVYVGQKDCDAHRYLVPVIYFNHPLFGELLREAEEEFGFHHPGGITIPCPESEFEKVQMKIAAGGRSSSKVACRRQF